MKTLGPREVEVLRELEIAGEYGIYGMDLKDTTWRFGSSIHLLRVHGFKIKSLHVHGRTWLYILETKLPKQGRLFE